MGTVCAPSDPLTPLTTSITITTSTAITTNTSVVVTNTNTAAHAVAALNPLVLSTSPLLTVAIANPRPSRQLMVVTITCSLAVLMANRFLAVI